MTSKLSYTPCESLVLIRSYDNRLVEVRCVGYFQMFRWWFLITEVIGIPGFYVITEASTGCNIMDNFCYDDIRELLRIGKQIIESKRYYFSTAVLNIIVDVQQNLLHRNLLNLQIGGTLLWEY